MNRIKHLLLYFRMQSVSPKGLSDTELRIYLIMIDDYIRQIGWVPKDSGQF